MEGKIIKSLVVLGVPGVTLGVFYLLLKKFNFEFEKVSQFHSALIAIIFILVVGGITLFALYRWSPKPGSRDGIAFSVPANASFQQVVRAVVATEGKSSFFNGFTQQELDAIIFSQDISADSTEEVLLLLRGLTGGSVRKYDVKKSKAGEYNLTVRN